MTNEERSGRRVGEMRVSFDAFDAEAYKRRLQELAELVEAMRAVGRNNQAEYYERQRQELKTLGFAALYNAGPVTFSKLARQELGLTEEQMPTPRGGSPRFYDLLNEMADVHAAKNADYSPGGGDPFKNFREAEEIGVPAWVGAWIRLQDKYKRAQGIIKQLREKGSYTVAVATEKLDDTVIDLANYAVIVRCLYEEWLEKGGVETDEAEEGVICDVCGRDHDRATSLFMGEAYICRGCSEDIYIAVASRVQRELMATGGPQHEGRDKS